MIKTTLLSLLFSASLLAQTPVVPLQPLAQQVRRLEDALNFVGQPLPAKTQAAIDRAIGGRDESAAVESLQQALDPFVLATVDINAESRVKVRRGGANSDAGRFPFLSGQGAERRGSDCAARGDEPQ